MCNFVASYFQALFNGLRKVWECDGEGVKIEVH